MDITPENKVYNIKVLNIIILKIIFIGNSFVGKTSIIKKYVNNHFDLSGKYYPTKGCEFYYKVNKFQILI